jgi:diaminohydroxyphosphoribosylaminopyrimidine deaminase/5-amino-6-(5-phosphoribosylamino)uracil reductase
VKPEEAMRSALSQARRALGRTFPNPSVGAVVFRGQRILGRGRTQPPGGSHAEVVAIESARRRHGERALRGASLAVTLEPCCFRGRTGPCTEVIIGAGIGRVYVGCRDPHRRVSGRGARQLTASGIEVTLGVLEADCRRLHRGFFSICQRGRPFVTLKLASSLDGRIATATGESRWITGPEARRLVHRLRARVDGVMVGSGTALADDPELTARVGDRVVQRPVRVLVDSKLRVPTDAKLYRELTGAGKGRTLVLTRARARRRRAVAATGAELLELPPAGGYIDLVTGMRALSEVGLTTLLVEGGGGLAAALLRAELVDEIHWLQAPRLLGGDGRPALGALGLERLADAVTLPNARVRRLGADLHLQASLWPVEMSASEAAERSRRRVGSSA